MSLDRLKQAYLSHAVWQQVGALAGMLEDAPRPSTDAAGDQLDLTSLIVRTLQEHESNWTPFKLRSTLDALTQHLAQVTSYVQNWINTQDPGHLQNLASYNDAILTAIATWTTGRDRVLRSTINAAKDFQRDAAHEMQAIRQTIEDFHERTNAIVGEVQSLRSEYTAFTEGNRNQVSSQIERLDAALNDMGSRFSNAEENRRAAFESEQVDRQEEFADSLSKQMELGHAHIQALKDHESQAQNLVNAVGFTATATDYGKYAEQERRAANVLRIAAILLILGGFGWLLLAAWVPVFRTNDFWQSAVVRIGGMTAIIAGGIYAARESAHHREQERNAKAKQLDLKALDPFVVKLPENQQDAIRGIAALRLFTDTAPDHRQHATGHLAERLVKSMVEPEPNSGEVT